MTTEELTHFKGADQGKDFDLWCLHHDEDGYFLSVQSARSSMLHRAKCEHFVGSHTGAQKVKKEKVCSTNKLALKQWAFRTGREVKELRVPPSHGLTQF